MALIQPDRLHGAIRSPRHCSIARDTANYALYLAARHPGTPWYAKVLAAAVAVLWRRAI